MLSTSPNRNQEKESAVKLSLEETFAHLTSTVWKVESVDVASTFVGIIELISDPHLGQFKN